MQRKGISVVKDTCLHQREFQGSGMRAPTKTCNEEKRQTHETIPQVLILDQKRLECILGYMSDMSDIWTGAENAMDIHERILKKKNSSVMG